MRFEKFEDLEIWQLARDLCKYIFRVTSNAPFCNDYKLRDQIRSSAGSVMDNIAEGFERGGNKEFIQFLYISKGSSGECRSQSYRAFDFNYIDDKTLNELLSKTLTLNKQISGFISYLSSCDYKGSKFHQS